MKELFPGYYRPTQEQFQQMWKECTFAFDANVLLNLYRYTGKTRGELLNIFELLKERTWLPHQAMLEYLENREEVISQQYSIAADIETALEEASEIIEARYRRGHPFADTKLITKQIKDVINKIKISIAADESKYPNLLKNDFILEQITSLFNGRVGSPYPLKRLEEIYKEIEQRFRLQIPPGYKDKNPKKEGFKKYGDGVLWFQVIEYAKFQKKPIIFVTDDQKDDWWRIEKGKTLGPRPELITEISSKAKVDFYMYNVSQFMKYAKELLGLQVNQKAIEEVKDVSQQNEDRGNLSRRMVLRQALYAEDAVYDWLKIHKLSSVSSETYPSSSIDFILTNPDRTKTGVLVKYSRSSFDSIRIREAINKVLKNNKLDFENLMLILVCEDSDGATATCARIRKAFSNPPTLTIIVGFLEADGSFKPFETFPNVENQQ